MECDIAHDPVALVEDRENGDALRHRRHARLPGGSAGLLCRHLVALLAAAIAAGKREPHQQRCRKFAHVYSGIHGS